MEYVVYVIHQQRKKGRIKIGFTSDLKQRLKQIQTGNPEPCVVIGVLKCKSKAHAMNVEAALHNKCRSHRTVGEWFHRGAINTIKKGTKLKFDWFKGVLSKDDADVQNKDHIPEGLRLLFDKTVGVHLDDQGRIAKKAHGLKKRAIILERELIKYCGVECKKSIKRFCRRKIAPPLPSLIIINGDNVEVVWISDGVDGDCRVKFTHNDDALFSCDLSLLAMSDVEMDPAFALRCVIAVVASPKIKQKTVDRLNAIKRVG